MDNWKKAGEIASEARKFGARLIKPGASIFEVTEKIEAKIEELNGNLAFPTQLSSNNVAAHYNALIGDTSKFGKNDLIKLDLGVHIEGCIADCAITVDLSGKNSKLVDASRNALKAAIEVIKPGITLSEVGSVISNEITSAGFVPIRNLSGHGLGEYNIHDSPSIPNYDNGDDTKLIKDQKIAIEPFASTGSGIVVEGKGSEVFGLQNIKNVRNMQARNIMKFVTENFKTLPFAKRHLLEKFNKFQIAVGVNNLVREGVLMEYHVLQEKDPSVLVSQAENTVIVGEGQTTF